MAGLDFSGKRSQIGNKLLPKSKALRWYKLPVSHKPIGVAEYQITHTLPEELRSRLPSIEQIEAELGL
ncbi:hypothetical protein ACN4EG_18675 [Alkalinema pantanalense CENA528]|uniref:hypothetical protein n=1 Tax=Alkalinema pantanalense TaxID=1620705 RepID=UPI003D6FFF6F